MNDCIEEPRSMLAEEHASEMVAMFARGYSTRVIGQHFGISKKTAGRRLQEAGVDLGGPGRKLQISDEYVEMTRKLRAEGMGWNEIAAKVGFCRRQLQKRLYAK